MMTMLVCVRASESFDEVRPQVPRTKKKNTGHWKTIIIVIVISGDANAKADGLFT